MTKRTSRPIRALGATVMLAGLSSVSGVAAAQSSQIPISVSADLRYDTNVTGGGGSIAAARGLSLADEHVALRADVNLSKQLAIFQTTLTGSTGYNFYNRNKQLNREFIALNGSALVNLSRCQLSLTSGIRRQQSDLGDLYIVGSPADDVRNTENQFNYGAQASCGEEIGFRPVLGIDRSTGTNSAPIRQFSDFDRTGYTAGLRYGQPVIGTLSLLGTIEEVSYPNRPRIGSVEDGYLSKLIGVRFERNIGSRLVGVVQVNYNTLRPRSSVGAFSGLTYNADLTATFADRLQLHASLSRSTRPSLLTDAGYSVETLYGLNATYAASERLSLNLGGSYKKRRYPGAGVLVGNGIIDDDRKQVDASVSFKAARRLRFSVSGQYSRRNADQSLYDYDNLSGGMAVTLVL